MSQNSCCVPGCDVVRKDGVRLHRFPNPEKSGQKFTTWILNIGGEIATMDHQDIYDNRRVCHRHFEEIHKYPSGGLSKLAIPTMHIPANSYHKFPHPDKNPDRFKAWVEIAGGKLDTPADYELYRKKIICDIHFTDRDRNRNNRLNFLAVPSLYLPGLPLHRFPNPNNPAQIERFRTWIMKIGGDIIGEDNDFIHRNRKVCHKHFEEIHTFPNMKLTALAIPTLEIPGVTIHTFPNPRTFQDRFRIWVSLAGASVSGLTDMQIYANRKVCARHFAEKDKTRNNRLNGLAIPHLHIPSE